MRHHRLLDNRGFTIIEVMIVLAIGGLIFSIIFLAVPALQRNARNNQRKQDVVAILDAISQWELNNSGAVPLANGDNFLANTKLSYYEVSDMYNQRFALGAGSGSHSSDGSLDRVAIYNYEKCFPDYSQATSNGAGYNDVVALYTIETSNGGNNRKCMDIK